MKQIFLLFTLLFITSACNKKLKETLGLSTAGPNEYQVQRVKTLETPPHYYLIDPRNNKTTYNNIKVKCELNEGEQALMHDMN
ncbi:DUF3035 domain-containing protein [Rickettsia typhi]|uniref:Lipoprotein n=2 Tax=Rickettsia typhi TaxID=785 RepID=Q68WX0_RICTY|nr:DUF3035 domain-containing protein [Rickettsia typhi]AAU03872.1 rickettsial conserved hypothetical protein [Rickettsia typhi str. Wilmington]AFE54254.1 hypothetical protein RTTH1527_01945 [Rickettsia typhi str. TH1527]AFE55094.1 hypothetical protein RTB9991CWPP_01955 [Rickettsia typhi str. B9991CWPP]